MKVLLIITCLFLSGCVNYGNTVLLSKGRAGAIQSFFGADAEFCKMSASKDYVFTEADKEALKEYCQTFEDQILERLSKL